MTEARILIAYGDDIARSALEMLLQQEPGLRVTGTAANGQELLHLATSGRPNLVLLDGHLPGPPAAELVPALQALDEGIKVIALISRPELRQAVQRAGVNGVVDLWEPPKKVVTAIFAAMCEADGSFPER
jgi:DNA-binding NarL/FixJ family response regulator